MSTLWFVDGFVSVLLVALAFLLLNSRNLFRAIVLFIVFGLLMAVTWARLDAPDIALAEAAIGAGITGALFLNAWSELRNRPRLDEGSLETREDGGTEER